MAELLIDVNGLGKALEGKLLVRGVTLRATSGDIVGLTGPVGGGKTTTLRMIAGLVRPDQGHGSVMGMDVAMPLSRRSDIAYMGQRLTLYPDLTTVENLRFHLDALGLVATSEMIERVLSSFGLACFAQMRAGALSNGAGRRLQFASIMLGAPRLLLLDEPCAGFDEQTRELIWAAITRIAAAGGAAIIATNDPAELARCTLFVPFCESQAGAQTGRGAPPCTSAAESIAQRHAMLAMAGTHMPGTVETEKAPPLNPADTTG